ncbi:conserved hypothetical protein [Leishmania mexicana MHOM/GT/2001/U1103]|uniref:Uncharacterized protein n=1 Tax=Leishmania mexicana (strain MHOM/GT/2001/U1103) TaxID=929439 RepID=E9AU07_LEIMU|nr:conserved hypothetical protein [Leishmania mexicana MHOM/GT/2001/U1103]CBZ26432.1 conserved hypothetical protein [Leishmania mexicana MHOM/GT/2001/U1103]
MHSVSLAGLCAELSRIQVDLLQRRGAPLLLAHEGIQLLREQLPAIELPSCVNSQISMLVPKLLRSCATVLRFAPDEDVLPALDALDFCAALTAKYADGGHLGGCINLNELCSLLRSTSALDDCQARLLELTGLPSHSDVGASLASRSSTAAAPTAPVRKFDSFLLSVYHHAMQLWSLEQERPTTLSVLSLLETTSRIYGKGFHFPAVGADKNSLLPAKAKVRMEAKMQRCVGARGLLTSLRKLELNRTDAGMCLATMAQTGLYDAEVCNRSCDILFSQHAILSSQQLCQVIFYLGTLQHRHIHQKFFSSLIEAEKCNAEAVRQHVLGLAMLRQPPPSEARIMNSVFLHALRAPHAHQKQWRSPQGSSSPSQSLEESGRCDGKRQHALSPRAHRALSDPLNDSGYTLPPQWYIDVGHGLACLGIQHPKYKLMTARQTRRSIGRLTTAERCKLLYALGGVPADQVPLELRHKWQAKVERTISIAAEKLKDMEPHEGPYVMNALLYCGIQDHPRIPRAPQLESDENPVEVLLRTWSTVPKERVLELTEQIKPQHLRTTVPNAPSALTEVLTRVAATFGAASREESHRLEPLCAAVEAHSVDMTADDLMRTLKALLQMGRTGPCQHDAIRQLLANLWERRYDMQAEQLVQCCECLQPCTDLPEAMRLLQFAASH